MEQVENLVRARVSCLKIEDRLKDEKYVAATTRAYRNAVDAAWEKILVEHEERGSLEDGVVATTRVLDSPEIVAKTELAQLFARGHSVVDKKMKWLIEAAKPSGVVQVSISGDVGTNLRVEIKDLSTGRVGVGESEGILTVAEQQGLQ